VENKQAALEKARAYAFLLLKFRPRSSQEISDRLKQKKYPSSVTKETVEFLKEKKFSIQNFAKTKEVSSN